jgi:flagellar hook protein FlgE
MIPPLNSALTALSAYGNKMGVTANNIANINTDGFKKSRVNMEEGPQGGVKATTQKIETPGALKEAVRNGGVVQIETSNVDLAEELTGMIPTKTAYGANLKSVKTQDQMMGSLLDLFS